MSRCWPWLASLGCLALAAWARLRWLDLAIPDRDAIAPFASAMILLEGRFPSPHHPHFGDALWLAHLPLVLLARSLEGAFRLRFAASAGVAFCGFWATWLLAPGSPRRRLGAALLAGLLLAWEPGLVDGAISGARGYGAPELVGLALLGAAAGAAGRGWGLPLMVGGALAAPQHHPLALGVLPALLLFAPAAWRSASRRARWVALGFGLAFGGGALARLLLSRAFLDQGGAGLLGVALGSSSASPLRGLLLLGQALRGWSLGEHGWGWWLLPVGLLLGLPRRASLAALLAPAGIALCGLATAHLDAHHLRIAAVPFCVGTALGWARLGPAPLLAGALALWTWRLPDYLNLPVRALRDVDAMARVVAAQPGPVWLDRASLGARGCLDLSGLLLSIRLQGLSAGNLALDLEAPLLLAACDVPRPAGADLLWEGEGRSLVRFPSVSAARAWALSFPAGRLDAGDASEWAAPLGLPPAETRWWEPGGAFGAADAPGPVPAMEEP